MKTLNNLAFTILFCVLLLLSSCTRKAFFTKDCDNIQIPAYEATNQDWKHLNSKILEEYKKCLAKPKIVSGARGVIIYRSLPKHRQVVEDMICEFWRSN